MTQTFNYFPVRPKKMTRSFIQKQYSQLVERIEKAESSSNSKEWIELFQEWNALKAYIWGEGSRIRFAYDRDMSNKKTEAADTYIREKVSPVTDEPEHALVTALLKSKHKQAVAERFGERLILEYENSLKLLDPINTELGVRASVVSKIYEKMIASGTVTIMGKRKSISEARTMLLSPDEKIRRAAFLAHRGWFINNRTALADIYSELVELRTKMAKNVGYENFVPLGYEGMSRIDYNRKEVETFRQAVKDYIVPLTRELAAFQAKGLKTKTLQPWDMVYFADSGLPSGIVPIDGQLDNAQVLFDNLLPQLGQHFAYMRTNQLIDLETRPNKRTGGYCNKVPDSGEVQILCNSVGDADDVHVLTHEMGHAFQGWETNHIEAVELQWPGADLCEVFSMGMEFLCMPHIEAFFSSDHAKRFTMNRFRDSLDVLVYVCIVDEFQHWVYENPEANSDERDAEWVHIWKSYRPSVDFSKVGDEYIAARWYAQAHIFSIPFYYIDYAIAETGALQLALLNEKDSAKTLQLYIDMARKGGLKGIVEVCEEAGLRSPFDKTLIKDLALMLRTKVLPATR